MKNNTTLLHEANTACREKKFDLAIRLYKDLQKFNSLPQSIIQWNIDYCKEKNAKSSYDQKTTPIHKIKSPLNLEKYITKNVHNETVTVTLTTIKKRIKYLSKVIESLHNQSTLPEKILLNISENPYLLDEGFKRDDMDLQALTKFPLIKIQWVENIGPYRKIVPYLQEFFNRKTTQDELFITVDDDTIYPSYFIEKLIHEHYVNKCVVAFRGRSITLNEEKIAPYSKWNLGQSLQSLANLPTGKDGIIYSTRFFNRDFLMLKDALNIAPTADDLWIKWHCAMNGVPSLILNPEASTSDYKSFPVVDYSPEYRDVSLYKAHNSHSTGGKNDRSVQDLEEYYLTRMKCNVYSMIQLSESASQ